MEEEIEAQQMLSFYLKSGQLKQLPGNLLFRHVIFHICF